MRRIAVIGAGWAGLSAALTLQRQGHHVTLYERSPAHQGAGGRASTAYATGDRAPFAIDNGQHVLLGAYSDTLALFESLNIDSDQAFLRLPAAWYVPQHLDIALAPWSDSTAASSPWNTGVFRQLPLALALFKASPTARWPKLIAASIRMQLSTPRSSDTVLDWLSRLQFPAVFKEQLWLPLCYATLNTPPKSASATVFKRVITDGLLAGSQAAAMLVPRVDLGQLFPAAALAQLQANGATLTLGTGVQGVTLIGTGVAVQADDSTQHFDALVCATSARDAARLLPNHCISPDLHSLAGQTPEPITTIHLNLGSAISLPRAVCILPDPIDSSNPIRQAVAIDRAYLNDAQTGWHTLVLSCSGQALAHNHEALIDAALRRLQVCFPALHWPKQCQGVVIHAKQATFACTAELKRPGLLTACPAVMLAGDYVAGPYPATLEGAVRSGIASAHAWA